jgi:long-chain acyl-CoA synthetase
MLVPSFLRDSAAARPDGLALIETDRSITYRELDGLTNRFANLLIRSGVRTGDRVVVALDNSAEQVAAYMGTMRAGGVAVPLPPGPRSDRLPGAIRDCAPAACIADEATLAALEPIGALDQVRTTIVLTAKPHAPSRRGIDARRALEAESPDPPPVRLIDRDLAAIIYTSGSTGEPRGVMLSHRNIVANTRSIIKYLRLTAADRVMCVLPFHYVYGLSLLHSHLAAGGSIVLDNRFAFPNVVLQSMRRHEVTGFAGVPSTFALLLHRSNITETELPHLRYVTQAGGAMPIPRIKEWLERGPKVPFFIMYGATEASARLSYLSPGDLERKLGSIGRAIPNVEILVVRDDGRPAAPGEVGELVARGSNIASGYWNSPSETAARFSIEGYRTGDLGYADDEGFLFLVGRKHDMMKVGANRVGAKEIEDVLHEFDGVREAAVVARADEILGEVPVAFVSLRDGCTADVETLRAHCGARLAAYKLPQQIFIQAELPKLAGVGKIDKVSLRQVASASSKAPRSAREVGLS